MANIFQETHLPRAEQEGYQYLATLPEVKKFLDAEIFEKIEHTRTQIIEGVLALVEFNVTAPKLMPHPRARMLEHGLITKNNCIPSKSRNTPGVVNQTISFYGNSLQVSLNFRS